MGRAGPRRPRGRGPRGAPRGTRPRSTVRTPRLMVGASPSEVKPCILLRDELAQMSRPSAQNRRELQAIARRVMTERGLEPDLSAEARAEVETITKPAAESTPGIRDLTGLLWASIDNDDSRDLDQLSVAEPLSGDSAKVLVADADAIVKKSSAIDDHARTNTTSVYTAAQVFPMLPEKLSTDLTSLGEGDK